MTELDTLPRRSFYENWKCREAKEPKYLVLGMGANLNSLICAVASRVASGIPEVGVATPQEVTRFAGSLEALRVIYSFGGVHSTTTDIIAACQGNDLFVQFRVHSRTWLKYLRYLVYGSLFLTLWSVVHAVMYARTAFFPSLRDAYFSAHFDSNMPAFREAQEAGIVYDEVSRQFVATSRRLTFIQILRSDPALVISQLITPMAISAGLIGLFVALLPAQFFRGVTRLVGWPTIEEFEARVVAHAVWVEGQLSTVLRDTFEVTEDRIIRVK